MDSGVCSVTLAYWLSICKDKAASTQSDGLGKCRKVSYFLFILKLYTYFKHIAILREIINVTFMLCPVNRKLFLCEMPHAAAVAQRLYRDGKILRCWTGY